MSLAGVAARGSSSQRLRRAGRRRRPGAGDRGARRDRPRLRQDRRPRRRPTSSRRSSPTASTTGCRRSTRACCGLYEQGARDPRDALASVDATRTTSASRSSTYDLEPSAQADLERRSSPHRLSRSARRPRRRVTMAAMVDVPPRLAPLLAPDRRRSRSRARSTDAGHECYLVGGAVRDALLDRTRGRAGRSTSRPTPGPTRSRRILRRWADACVLAGQALRHGRRASSTGEPFEITTFRAEVYRPESRKPEVALRRRHRDRPVAARLHGQRDGAARSPEPELDRPVRRRRRPRRRAGCARRSRPEVSFTDDPLRMLRAARFVAGFGLEPVPELVAAVERAPATGWRSSSAERIRDELSKLLVVDDPAPGLWFLVDTGLADEFLPELQRDAARAGPDPPPQGRARAHDRGGGRRRAPTLVLRLAALLHDVGKPKTRSFDGPRA